jgi:Rrf2 family protein
MPGVLKMSEATTLALHTMVYLAEEPNQPASAREMATRFKASEAHLAKVLQRLGKVGLVHSTRGPKGGFTLAKDPDQVTLLEVYEAIEGPLEVTACLFDPPVCNGDVCILGGLAFSVNKQVRDHLANTRLSDLSSLNWRKQLSA